MERVLPMVPTPAVRRVRGPETKNFRAGKMVGPPSDTGKPHLVFIVAKIKFSESDRM